MAQRRRRNEQTNGVKDGSWGVSQKALDALESGTYGQMTGRKAKYRTSQEQTQQVNGLPALEGLFTEAKPQTWERKFGKSNVDTDRARRSYEQRIGHNASDFRDLRNKGYESTRRDFDFSDYDESLKANHRIDFGLFGNRGINELSALDTPNMPSIEYDMAHPEEISNAERQKYIDVFGAPMEDVIPAYQSYKKQWEQNYAEEQPIRVGLEDIGSAFERGNEATTNRIIDKFVKNEKVANALKRGTTSGLVDKVENKRDYVRNSDKLSDTQKSWLEALYGGGDFLSSTATGSLLTGGLGVANPETGFGLTVEPSKLVRGLVEAYNKFGLGKTQEYGALKRRGVSEEEAQKMSDYSGAVAGLTSGATAGLGGMGGNSGSAVKNAVSAFFRSTALGGVTQTANEFAEKKILDDQSIYELSKQAYMEQGMSEEEAAKKADADRYGRIGGAAILNGVLGLGSNLLSQGVRGIKNALVPSESDPLNSVWATQPALEGETFPRLTGTVDNAQALSGSQYNVPALVDNIYPIQMPGTNGVIPMPGTNGVITPVVGGGSAPISNIADDIDWRVGSPRYVKKLEGADLEAATKQIADNNAAIGRIKNEIEIIKGDKGNYYRGKLKKAVQTDIANREKEIKKIEGNTKELTHQVNGGLKPMLDMLTTEQKNNIYSVNGKHDSVFSDINFMAKFAGDTPEAKKLAKTAQNAISRYVRTGDVNEVKTMTDALMELDQMAKATNAVWTSSRGNEWTYGQRFGEQAKPLYNLKPVTDIYNLERALEKGAGKGATSVSVEAPTTPIINPAANYTPEQQAVVDGYNNAEDGSISTWISNVRSGKKAMPYKPVAIESDITADYVQNELNLDIHGNKVGFSKSFLNHDTNEHMSNKGKSQITDADLARIAYVIENPDDIVVTGRRTTAKNLKDDSLAPTIALRKRIDGYYYIIEAVTDAKKKEDIVINAFLEKVGNESQEYKDMFSRAYHVANAFDDASNPLPNVQSDHENNAMDISISNVNEVTPNVNTVPEVTNEPNFTTVGEPYTPQEIPNIKPTPPTTPPPEQEVPNMGGTEKTSQYYKNTMRGTETNRDMSDTEYADRFDEELFKRMTIPEQQSVNMGRNFIKESGGRDAAIERLLSGDFDSEERFSGFHIDAAEMLANDLERQALELEKMGQDASDLWRKANRLHKKIQLNASDFGVGMQALQKWKKSTPQGAYDDLVSQINKGIDKKKTTGYTRNVNDLADKIEDAIANSNSKEDLLSKIREIFGKNRENSDYNTKKAEQQVLDLVGGSKNNKKSITDLAEEASRIIKKEMGVSTLTPREERAVLNLLDAASQVEPGTRAYNELVSQAMVIVDESLPSSMGEKFKSLLYDNMLASIKTMFTRNFGGNVVGNAIDAMAAPFQVGADAIVGKFTGARTRSLTGKSIIAAAKGLGHGFKDWGQDIGYSLKNKTAFNTARSGQESLADVLRAVHKTWKTQSQNKAVKAVHNALSAYDYVIRKGMEGGDRPIYEAQYAATKAELYDVVDKYGDAGIRKGLPADKRDLDTDDLIEAMAINEGLEAVLQNDSKMKEAAKNLKAFFKKSSEDMLGIDIASMSHAPFVEVPANMASNFFKLTPIGWAGNIARTIGEKKKYGSINQRRFTGELGLNVLGGLLIGGGVAAADKFISGPYSEDKDEKKLQQNNGYLEYALQTPDESTQVDISDIPYLGPMLKFAKTERDAYKENGLEGALSAVPSAASAATVDTLYQALNRLTGADFQYNGNGNLISNAVSNIKSSVGSMGVPSVVRQTAQFTDPYKRDLGDYGTDEYNKNLIINGIPGLRQTMLEPKIDTAGQPVPELGGATGIRRFLSAYVSPYKVSHPHENTSAVQEYANMLKLATEGAVNPQMKVINASDLKKIKGYDAENYSHADLRELQEDYYKSNTELGNALINDPWFTNLSYEKQGELLDQLWSANKALVSEEFVRKGLTPEQIEAKGDELYTTDNKLAGIIRDDDEKHTGLLKWLKDETSRDEVNAKYGTEMSHDDYVKYNEREEGYAEQRASEAAKAKALGMSVDNYEKYEAEYEGGAQGRYDDVEAAKQYGFVDANKKANTDAYNIAKQLGNGDPTVIQAYSDYKKQGYNSNAYGAKASYLVDEDRFTPTQKGMIIVGSQDGTLKGKVASGARNAFDIGNSNGKNDGYAGIYYYYLLKNMADADNSGSVTKKEREAFIAGDNRYLDELWNLNQDMYNYLAANLK